jgi:hypothetical protein
MRIEYKCVCDRCGKGIINANDENEVSLKHTGHYQFCPTCYDDLCRTIDIWMRNE